MKRSKNKRPMSINEKRFRLISVLFILLCCVFYGYRLIHFYRIFNPSKQENSGLLSIEIPKNSTLVTEGIGLYKLNGAYIYRGNVEDNYIKFSGLTFRILKINYGASTEIILDEPINILAYGSDKQYEDSDINKYLNEEFVSILNKKMLEKMTICNETKEKISDECTDTFEAYSTVLDSKTFLSTINDGTYLTLNNELLWLNDTIKDDLGNVIANQAQISYVDNKESYSIKPIVSLKFDTKILGGTGTKDDPYIVEENDDYVIGKKTYLGGYHWIIIGEDKESYTLALDGTLDSLKPFGESFDPKDTDSVAYYLNDEFINLLSFKNDILTTEWEIGNYTNSYESIENTTKEAKIGMLSVKDFKFGSYDNQYLLLNKNNDNQVYVVDTNMYEVDTSLSKAIRPVVRVKKDTVKIEVNK